MASSVATNSTEARVAKNFSFSKNSFHTTVHRRPRINSAFPAAMIPATPSDSRE